MTSNTFVNVWNTKRVSIAEKKASVKALTYRKAIPAQS